MQQSHCTIFCDHLKVLTSGWGVFHESHFQTSNGETFLTGPTPNTLQEIALTTLTGCAGEPSVNNAIEFCSGILNAAGNGFAGGKDTCSGDSGGPAALNRNNNLNYELVGAVSRAKINAICEAPGQATVWADVYGNSFGKDTFS